MTMFLLILFAGVCLALIGWGMLEPGRVCQFPFLAGATFAGFVLPQAAGVVLQGHPPPGTDAALIMCILCSAMCWAGWASSDAPVPWLNVDFDPNRLLVVSAVLSGIGAIAFAMIARLPDELLETGGWSGVAVVYFFFAQVLRYGFGLAMLILLAYRSRWALAIVAFDCLALYETIVIRARRGFTVEFLLALACSFWFVYRKTLPRWAIPILLVAGVLGITGAQAYRMTMYQDQKYGGSLRHDVPWDEIARIDFVDVFMSYNQEESYEFRNLAYLMNTTDDFDGGLSYWNEFVFIFVPAQVVGAETKEKLRFDLPGEVTDPHSPNGTTITGAGDSYQAFGWFGCLVFFGMAFVLRRFYATAMSGSLLAQLIYLLIITSALHTVTHHTKWFVTGSVHMAIFLAPGLWWARKPADSPVAPGAAAWTTGSALA